MKNQLVLVLEQRSLEVAKTPLYMDKLHGTWISAVKLSADEIEALVSDVASSVIQSLCRVHRQKEKQRDVQYEAEEHHNSDRCDRVVSFLD